jgi:hypothetical protein
MSIEKLEAKIDQGLDINIKTTLYKDKHELLNLK